jgi:ComEC/Rec2-related protein
MAFFIAHFCIGVVLARIGLGPRFGTIESTQYGSYVFVTIGFICWVRGWIGFHISSLSIAGILWGLSHSGQTLLQESLNGMVVRVASTSNTRGPLLVATDSGVVFETIGFQRLGVHGRLQPHDSEGLFSSSRVTFRPIFEPRSPTLTWWQKWQNTFQLWAHESTKRLNRVDRVLTAGVVFGMQGTLPKTIEESFKKTGLYHLLVVSGLHVSLMAALFASILKAPLQLGYSLRLISPQIWRQLSALLQIGAVLGALAYLSLTGASAAAQRSALFFAVRGLSLVFCGVVPFKATLLVTAAMQILFFPLGFVSEGTCMSWAAYLVVARPRKQMEVSIQQTIWLVFFLQVELMVLVTAVFGQLILIGLVTNLLFVSVFPVILVACLIAILSPWVGISTVALAFPHNYMNLVAWFHQLTEVWPFLSISRGQLPVGIRVLSLLISIGIILNAFRRLSIREEGGVEHG